MTVAGLEKEVLFLNKKIKLYQQKVGIIDHPFNQARR